MRVRGNSRPEGMKLFSKEPNKLIIIKIRTYLLYLF